MTTLATREVASPRPWVPISHDPSTNPQRPGQPMWRGACGGPRLQLTEDYRFSRGSVPQGGTSDSPLRVLAVGPPWPHPCTGEVSKSPSSDPCWFCYPDPSPGLRLSKGRREFIARVQKDPCAPHMAHSSHVLGQVEVRSLFFAGLSEAC